MTSKFLIDECLSPVLVQLARDAGHPQSTCVREMDLDLQEDLFRLALREFAIDPDLINSALELTMRENEMVDIVRYEIIAPSKVDNLPKTSPLL